MNKAAEPNHEPLSDAEIDSLHKRIDYQAEADARDGTRWIDLEIWQRTLATIDHLRAQLDEANACGRAAEINRDAYQQRLGQVVHANNDLAAKLEGAESALAEAQKEMAMNALQIDPKYHVEVTPIVEKVEKNGLTSYLPRPGIAIVKTSNGEAIPDDEPLILFRGRDRLAFAMLLHYRQMCVEDGCNDYHLAGIDNRIVAFAKFAAEHPERMKQPGITRGL